MAMTIGSGNVSQGCESSQGCLAAPAVLRSHRAWKAVHLDDRVLFARCESGEPRS
jgi:hypothetical protein